MRKSGQPGDHTADQGATLLHQGQDRRRKDLLKGDCQDVKQVHQHISERGDDVHQGFGPSGHAEGLPAGHVHQAVADLQIACLQA